MSNIICYNQEGEFEKYLNEVNWSAGKTKNQQSFCAALRSVSLGLSADIAYHKIRERILASGGSFISHKVERDLRRAAGFADRPWNRTYGNNQATKYTKPPRAIFDPNSLRVKVSHLKDFNVVEMLAQRSIRPPSKIMPDEFLSAAFYRGERIRLFAETHVGQGHEFIAGDNILPLNTSTQAGAWFLCHPVDGEARINDEGNHSYRSHQNGTRFPYLVLETDDAPEDEWLAFLASLEACVVAITHSGKRGAHGLIRVDCKTWEEVQVAAAQAKADYVKLGACPGALRAGLTRLPGFMREGQEQKLLFLNPRTAGDTRAILELEPTALGWRRLGTSIIEDYSRGKEEFTSDHMRQAIKSLEEWGEQDLAGDLKSIRDASHIEAVAQTYEMRGL